VPQTVVPPRSAVDPQYTWDTASIFPSTAAWEAAFAEVAGQISRLGRFRGRLASGPAVLADWFEEVQGLYRAIGRVVVYASMCRAVDTTDQEAAARFDRARGLQAQALAAAAFAEPELIAIGFEALRRWLRDEPRLAIFEHYVDRLERRQAHVRSPEVEELLGRLMDPFRTAAATHGILTDADLVFAPAHATGSTDPIEVAQGNIGALLAHPDREVRRTAWESYADAHLAHRHAMANCLAAGVKQNVFLARARGYGSSLEAALEPNHIPVAVFHNLIGTYRKHLSIWHRYWRIRRRALGYDRLHVYDRAAPLTPNRPTVPFAQAVEWIVHGMQPLGDEYVTILRRGLLEERWVDVYPNKGKASGAFSTGSPGTHPFILMSYNDDVFGMSTLAHELGHSMHSYYAWSTQPIIYARYGLFLAEVASNFNQAMVRSHLLAAQSDPEFQIAVIEEAMGNFHRYFLVMPTLARLELEIHERIERGGAVTARDLMTLTTELFAEAYGGEVEIDADRVGITWAEFPTHLYANFYVYQYATGISGANALVDRILGGEPGAVEGYLEFLKTGGSIYPLDALKRAGVDLASPEPVERAFDVLSRLVDRLDRLLAGRRPPS
jgi:oligoendopeptidase F